jgi:flagellar biosynthetic protein FliR
MTELLNTISPAQFKMFILVLIRVSVILQMFPIFGTQMLPPMVKAGLALVISLGLVSAVGVDPTRFPDSTVSFLILMVSELIIGAILGLTVRLFFAAVQLAGQLISFQMGFAMINVIDPATGGQVSILDQIGYWVALLVFLLLGGHHIMIYAISESFQLIDMGTISLKKELLVKFVALSSDIFIISLKIGAPGIVALLFVSTAFGLCAKFSPQMNILIAAFPVKIIVGLFFFGITLQIIVIASRTYLDKLPRLFTTILTLLGTT